MQIQSLFVLHLFALGLVDQQPIHQFFQPSTLSRPRNQTYMFLATFYGLYFIFILIRTKHSSSILSSVMCKPALRKEFSLLKQLPKVFFYLPFHACFACSFFLRANEHEHGNRDGEKKLADFLNIIQLNYCSWLN